MGRYRQLVDLLFPPSCRVCQREGHWWCAPGSDPLWPVCLVCSRPAPHIGDASRCRTACPIIALGRHDGRLRDAIHDFKYEGYRAICTDWAMLLAPAVAPLWQTGDCLVPIPLHWSRQLSRGYNQSAVLASQLAKELHGPVRHLLTRTHATRQQITIATDQRLANVQGSFRLKLQNPAQPLGGIWLVDDVATTGATLIEARRVLVGAGLLVRGAIVVGLAR